MPRQLIPIDWEKCKQDLKELFPRIGTILEERIDAILPKVITHSIGLEDFPPHIAIGFDADVDPALKFLYNPNQLALDRAIRAVAADYNLRASNGCYTHASRLERRVGVRNFYRDDSHFVLKPNYDSYRIT